MRRRGGYNAPMPDSTKTAIRPATEADLAAITDIYNEAVQNTTATFDTETKTVEDRLAWYNAHGPRHPVLVIEQEGQVAGWGSLSAWSDRRAYDSTVETTIYIAATHRGLGLGTKLNNALIETARENGFHTVIARITAGSDASIRLHERCGFEHVGTMKEVGHKFGQHLDVHVMQLML